jgi:hypothetical protein
MSGRKPQEKKTFQGFRNGLKIYTLYRFQEVGCEWVDCNKFALAEGLMADV